MLDLRKSVTTCRARVRLVYNSSMNTTHETPMKEAACAMIPVSPDEFLTISRRGSTSAWGLPGGKVDPGETVEEAVVREVFEELGVRIDRSQLKAVYTGVCDGDQTFRVTTFLVLGGPSLVGMQAEAGMILSKHTLQDLADQAISPFALYNTEVLKAFSKL